MTENTDHIEENPYDAELQKIKLEDAFKGLSESQKSMKRASTTSTPKKVCKCPCCLCGGHRWTPSSLR